MAKRDLWAEGLPAFVWPSLITLYSLVERVLAGFKVGAFFELNTSPNNYLPQVLGIVLSGFIGNSWMKKSEARKAAPADTKSESITVTKESSSPQGSQSPQQPLP